ncbi:MAG: helix-turn-helix domain-containing protein [Chloroflexi bacterium]|nr:helix-turn-helix domain-containing protein [Chloroflexota bacterium]
MIQALINRDGRSLNQVAQAALIDVGYLWRLREGARAHPSRDVLIRLGLALRLEPEELDELLVAADYAPVTLRRL